MSKVEFEWKGSITSVLQGKFNRLKTVLKDAVKVEEGRVKERTQAGQGLNTSWLGYSQGWAEVRKRKNLRTDIVDLTFTGAMFKNMRTDSKDDGPSKTTAFVWFGGDQLSNDKAVGNNKGRPFFGFSKEQLDIILSKLRSTK